MINHHNKLHLGLTAVAGTLLLVQAETAFAKPPKHTKADNGKKPERNKAKTVSLPVLNLDRMMEDKMFQFLSDVEGVMAKSYRCTAGKCTVGVGFNIDDNKALFQSTLGVDDKFTEEVKNGKRKLDDQQIRKLFSASLNQAKQVLLQKLSAHEIDFASLKDGQKMALLSLAFNSPALIGPKLCGALRAGDEAGAAAEIALCSNRDKIWGISVRREKESVLFLGHQLSIKDRENYLQRPLNETEKIQYDNYDGKELSVRITSPTEILWRDIHYRPPLRLDIGEQRITLHHTANREEKISGRLVAAHIHGRSRHT